MRYRLLALLVIVAAAAHVLLASAASSPAAISSLHFAFRIVGRTVAAAACFAAAARFERGDYLRRGWLLLGSMLLLLVVKDLRFGPSLHGLVPPELLAGRKFDAIGTALIVALNVLGVASTWVLARTWYRAGLGLGVSTRVQLFAMAVATGTALAIAGPTFLADLGALTQGRVDAMAMVASDLSDLVTFVLFAPLVLTALALRGGLLAWTWGFLVAGNLAWLLMDVAATVSVLGSGTPSARLSEEVARTVAAACFAGAGWSQRWLLDEATDGGSRTSG